MRDFAAGTTVVVPNGAVALATLVTVPVPAPKVSAPVMPFAEPALSTVAVCERTTGPPDDMAPLVDGGAT